MKLFRGISIFALATAIPGTVFADSSNTLQSLAHSIAQIFNAGAILLLTATLVVYFYGVVANIYKRGQGEKNTNLRETILWGVIIIFVMVSLWGIIQYFQTSLFGGTLPLPINSGGTSSGSGI